MTVTNFKSSEEVVVGEGVNGPFEVVESLQGSAPATAANYGTIYIATRKMRVIDCKVVWGTAGGSGATVMLERLQSTEAKDAGDDLWSSAVATDGTALTVNTPTMVTVQATRTLEVGDRLGLVNAGVLTALANLVVTVLLEAVD